MEQKEEKYILRKDIIILSILYFFLMILLPTIYASLGLVKINGDLDIVVNQNWFWFISFTFILFEFIITYFVTKYIKNYRIFPFLIFVSFSIKSVLFLIIPLILNILKLNNDFINNIVYSVAFLRIKTTSLVGLFCIPTFGGLYFGKKHRIINDDVKKNKENSKPLSLIPSKNKENVKVISPNEQADNKSNEYKYNPYLLYFILMFIFPFIIGILNIYEIDSGFFYIHLVSDNIPLLSFIFLIYSLLESIFAYLNSRFNKKSKDYIFLIYFSWIIKLIIIFIINIALGSFFENNNLPKSLDIGLNSIFVFRILLSLFLAEKLNLLFIIAVPLFCIPTIIGTMIGKYLKNRA